MRYPKLYTRNASRDMVDEFRGYNHNLRIGGGEMYDELNLSSDLYPVMSPRKPRGIHITEESITGMIEKDALCYTSGTEFVMNEYRVEMGLSDEPKQLVSMGAKVIILPDKKYINTADITDFGNLEASFTTQDSVRFTLAREDGTDYNPEYIGNTEPTEPAASALWIDTSSVPHTLKQWSESGMWVTIPTTYVKIDSAGIGAAFAQYDGVEISGLTGVELIDSVSGTAIDNPGDLQALEGSAVIWSKGDDYITIVGMLDITRSITNQITVSRYMPNMDFVIECGNRLWGCRYGVARNGQVVNEIYASKLGDPKNWNCFMGISTDSWVGSLGSDGAFTGAITHLGYPLFFKERTLHKVYPSEVGAHSIQDTACRGVQRGSEKSLAIVNEILYYKSSHAVCAYDGSLPVEVSPALGNEMYYNAVGGAHGNKYYVSMTSDESCTFVYDTGKGIWHKEDGAFDEFCSCGGEMYGRIGGTIFTLLGGGTDDVEWMAETGDIGLASPDQKYVSRINIRMSMAEGAKLAVHAMYDSDGDWYEVCDLYGTDLRSFSIPIRPMRSDHMKLLFTGVGDARIYSITKTVEQGSDRSW